MAVKSPNSQSDVSDVKMKLPKKISAFNAAKEDTEDHHTGDNKSKSSRGKKLTQQEKNTKFMAELFQQQQKSEKLMLEILLEQERKAERNF